MIVISLTLQFIAKLKKKTKIAQHLQLDVTLQIIWYENGFLW